MKRDEAIKYLEKKGKIVDEKSLSVDEVKDVKKVMKEGKIYGDPVARIQW